MPTAGTVCCVGNLRNCQMCQTGEKARSQNTYRLSAVLWFTRIVGIPTHQPRVPRLTKTVPGAVRGQLAVVADSDRCDLIISSRWDEFRCNRRMNFNGKIDRRPQYASNSTKALVGVTCGITVKGRIFLRDCHIDSLGTPACQC